MSSPPLASSPEIRWPRVRSDKADPVVLALPDGWEVVSGPWWVAGRPVPGRLVLQVHRCGWHSGRLVLKHPGGRTSVPVRADLDPQVRQAVRHGALGFLAALAAGFLIMIGLQMAWTLNSMPSAVLRGPVGWIVLPGFILAVWGCSGGAWSILLLRTPDERSVLAGAVTGGLAAAYLYVMVLVHPRWLDDPWTRGLLLLLGPPLMAAAWGGCLGGWRLAGWAFLCGLAPAAGLTFWWAVNGCSYEYEPAAIPVALLGAAAGLAARMAPRVLLPAEIALRQVPVLEPFCE